MDLISQGQCGPGEDEPSLSVSALDAGEADGTASFQLQLSAPSPEAAAVTVAVRPDTAAAGDDFVPISFTAIFEPGQLTVPVPVTVIDDAQAEGLETLRLELSDPQGPTSNVDSIGGIIRDDEPSPCGAPGFDPAVDAGSFLWKDCGSGEWHLRATAGGTSYRRYPGVVESSSGFAGYDGDGLEFSDELSASSAIELRYQLNLVPPYYDGVCFRLNPGGTTCCTAELPTGSRLVVGAGGQQPVANSFDLRTLGPCVE